MPYGRSRLLQDTPESPIRSIAMGFVRIHGKAKSDQLSPAPLRPPLLFLRRPGRGNGRNSRIAEHFLRMRRGVEGWMDAYGADLTATGSP